MHAYNAWIQWATCSNNTGHVIPLNVLQCCAKVLHNSPARSGKSLKHSRAALRRSSNWCPKVKPMLTFVGQKSRKLWASSACKYCFELALSLLQTWPIESIELFHWASNSNGDFQYCGNIESSFCFSCCSSSTGRPGRSLSPATVHCTMTVSPK